MKNFFIQLAKEQQRLDEEKKAQRRRELMEERAHLLKLVCANPTNGFAD